MRSCGTTTNTYFTWPILAAGGGYVFGRDAQGNLDPSKVGVNAPGAIKAAKCWPT